MDVFKPLHYHLEIYEPGSTEDRWVSLKATTPFMAVSTGDVVTSGMWDGSQSSLRVLRAVGIDHVVWETEYHIGHKVMVYTEDVEGTDEIRVGS